MRIAVVTPYFAEPLEVLRRCHLSVLGQQRPCRHVLVADGPANPEVDAWDCDHVRVPGPHRDIGSTPRFIGSYLATLQGYDAVAFLDADNWYRDDHLVSLVRLQQETGAAFLSSSRMLCRPDGSVMRACPNTDPERFIDTSCMMFMRPAFPVISYWVGMPLYAHDIGDRVILHYVKQSGAPRAHSTEPSVFYTCGKPGIYRQLGEPVPAGVTEPPDYETAFRRWIADGHPPLV